MNEFKYQGKELDIFSIASNWKSYWSSRIIPYIGKTVLEVGAGIGSNTIFLCHGSFKRWTCLEPDVTLFHRLSFHLKKNISTSNCEFKNGTLRELSKDDLFDTILYIDVLEHIDDDKAEIDLAIKHLGKQGKLIILSPAHNWLFSNFDKAIGHYRRYDKQTFRKIVPKSLGVMKLEYLDSVGLFLSFGNSFILKRTTPSEMQIQIWDSFIFPLSRLFDYFTHYKIGKSILGVWCHEI